jgi:hypothetical protein
MELKVKSTTWARIQTPPAQVSASESAGDEAFGQVTGAQAGAYPLVPLFGYDVPNVAGNVTCGVQGQISGGFTLTYSGDAAQLVAREFQI